MPGRKLEARIRAEVEAHVAEPVIAVLAQLDARGIGYFVPRDTGTVRHVAQQAELAATGASLTLKSKHVPAEPGERARAVDVLLVEQGRVLHGSDPRWDLLAELARRHGLVCGRAWACRRPDHNPEAPDDDPGERALRRRHRCFGPHGDAGHLQEAEVAP